MLLKLFHDSSFIRPSCVWLL